MSEIRIDQVLPSFAPHDAIGFHTLEMQRLIRSLGVESEIYADEIKEGMEDFARPFKNLMGQKSSPDRHIIYQTSTGSPITRHLSEREEPIVINYHNITPKDILGRWDIGVGIIVGAGIKQLAVLKEKISGAISVSEYNKWCLTQEGITDNSLVAPPFIPEPDMKIALQQTKPQELTKRSRWLFVGRIAPNKAQHDIIRAFSAYLMGWDNTARLTLVGSVSSQTYADSLRRLIEELGISNSVTMTGGISAESLESEYRRATTFVCLSDHEGFGFPIIEAMRHSLPVVAYSAAAITETVGTAGILLQNKDPIWVAAAVAMVEKNHKLRNDLLLRSVKNAQLYSLEHARSQNLIALRQLIPPLAAIR